MTYDDNEFVRWRAIEAIGWVVAAYAEYDLDKVRDMLRRLLWQMNDESGGLTWHSPELIGEILVNVPTLIPEYADLLPSYLVEEPFERGTHFAVYRAALVDPKPFRNIIPKLVKSLDDPDPTIRAYSALALGAIGAKSHRADIERLLDDQSLVNYYDFACGEIVSKQVSELAQGALDMVNTRESAA